jgi:hypothetical protein
MRSTVLQKDRSFAGESMAWDHTEQACDHTEQACAPKSLQQNHLRQHHRALAVPSDPQDTASPEKKATAQYHPVAAKRLRSYAVGPKENHCLGIWQPNRRPRRYGLVHTRITSSESKPGLHQTAFPGGLTQCYPHCVSAPARELPNPKSEINVCPRLRV